MFTNVTISLLEGFFGTLKLFSLTLLFSLPLGLIISFGSMNKSSIVRLPIRFIIWIIRGTPLMLQLLIIFYGPGVFLGVNLWGSGDSGRFTAALVAFVINYACYFSEIFRGGIQSIPKGQYEAASMLGMTKMQTFVRIILPQVTKRVVPATANEVITLVKDTSLANIIAYAEITMKAKQQMNTYSSILPLFIAGLFYFVLNAVVTVVFALIEKKFNYYK
jgi:polar amino acid transport system permease protein